MIYTIQQVASKLRTTVPKVKDIMIEIGVKLCNTPSESLSLPRGFVELQLDYSNGKQQWLIESNDYLKIKEKFRRNKYPTAIRMKNNENV